MRANRLTLSRLISFGAILMWGTLSLAAGDGSGVTADEALQRLLDGNKRYVESKMKVCGEANAAVPYLQPSMLKVSLKGISGQS